MAPAVQRGRPCVLSTEISHLQALHGGGNREPPGLPAASQWPRGGGLVTRAGTAERRRLGQEPFLRNRSIKFHKNRGAWAVSLPLRAPGAIRPPMLSGRRKCSKRVGLSRASFAVFPQCTAPPPSASATANPPTPGPAHPLGGLETRARAPGRALGFEINKQLSARTRREIKTKLKQ